MPYSDLLNSKLSDLSTTAGNAVADLSGVVAGADVLASQFSDVKNALEDLQQFVNEFKGGYYYTPVGLVAPFGGTFANRPPAGWLFCDGAAYSTTTYSDLFAVIGTSFGSGSGTFKVPDLRSRVPVGATDQVSGSAPALGIDANGTTLPVRALGAGVGAVSVPEHSHPINAWATTDGAGSHAHTIHGVGDHAHSINATREVIGRASGGSTFGKWDDSGAYRATNNAGAHSHGMDAAGAHNHTIPATNTQNAGAGNHGVVQPSLVLSFIIKA